MTSTIAFLCLAIIGVLISFARAVPSSLIADGINKAIATDTTYLANVAAMKLHLIVSPFTPSPALVFASLTEASFGGYVVLSPTIGAQGYGTDPLTGQGVVYLQPPIGGFRFAPTSSTGLPQTVYGWVLTDNASANILASAVFFTPIPLTGAGQIVEVNDLLFTVNANPLS